MSRFRDRTEYERWKAEKLQTSSKEQDSSGPSHAETLGETPQPNGKAHDTFILWAGVAVGISLLLGIALWSKPESTFKPESKTATKADDILRDLERSRGAVEHAVTALLTAWQTGESGDEYWVGGISAVRLFTVRGFQKLKCFGDTFPEPTQHGVTGIGYCTYRVKSSTKGGFPIEKDWRVTVLQKDGVWKVAKFEDAE